MSEPTQTTVTGEEAPPDHDSPFKPEEEGDGTDPDPDPDREPEEATPEGNTKLAGFGAGGQTSLTGFDE
jgi:hypothetical protein